MPYKPGYLRDDTTVVLPYRDPTVIERLVGKKRAAVQIGTGFWEWPLWQAYPTWCQFNEQLANERTAAQKENRAAHPAASEPKLGGYEKHQRDAYGEQIGARVAMGIPPQKYKPK
jgi:hypothetical protein